MGWSRHWPISMQATPSMSNTRGLCLWALTTRTVRLVFSSASTSAPLVADWRLVCVNRITGLIGRSGRGGRVPGSPTASGGIVPTSCSSYLPASDTPWMPSWSNAIGLGPVLLDKVLAPLAARYRGCPILRVAGTRAWRRNTGSTRVPARPGRRRRQSRRNARQTPAPPLCRRCAQATASRSGGPSVR